MKLNALAQDKGETICQDMLRDMKKRTRPHSQTHQSRTTEVSDRFVGWTNQWKGRMTDRPTDRQTDAPSDRPNDAVKCPRLKKASSCTLFKSVLHRLCRWMDQRGDIPLYEVVAHDKNKADSHKSRAS